MKMKQNVPHSIRSTIATSDLRQFDDGGKGSYDDQVGGGGDVPAAIAAVYGLANVPDFVCSSALTPKLFYLFFSTRSAAA